MVTNDVWSVYERLLDRDWERLNEAQRAVVAICDLRQEVGSGGFDSYFRYAGGDHAPYALAALPSALGKEWAELLGRAMAVFGSSYPTDTDRRREALDMVDADARLAALDTGLYELEAASNADAKLADWLERRPEVGR